MYKLTCGGISNYAYHRHQAIEKLNARIHNFKNNNNNLDQFNESGIQNELVYA